MNKGLLLDSHSLLWLEGGALMLATALQAIDSASLKHRLYSSQISIWELGVALLKKNPAKRPNLRGLSADVWFMDTTARFDIRVLKISDRIALEASNVPSVYGSGDPGDCFLIATARVRGLSLVTRDKQILKLAHEHPGYLNVIAC